MCVARSCGLVGYAYHLCTKHMCKLDKTCNTVRQNSKRGIRRIRHKKRSKTVTIMLYINIRKRQKKKIHMSSQLVHNIVFP